MDPHELSGMRLDDGWRPSGPSPAGNRSRIAGVKRPGSFGGRNSWETGAMGQRTGVSLDKLVEARRVVERRSPRGCFFGRCRVDVRDKGRLLSAAT